jgi:signal transduction histidine kinase
MTYGRVGWVRRWRALGFRQPTRERLRWAIRIRAAVIGLFLALASAAWAASLLASLGPPLLAAVAGTALNLAVAACVRRWRGIGAMLLWSGAGDVLIITYVVWATGGSDSPFLFLYALQVVTTALLVDLPTAALAGVLGMIVLAIALLAAPPLGGGPSAPERLTGVLSLALTLLLLIFIGGYLARRLARTERELAGAHRRLGRSMRRLARAHADLQDAYGRLARAEAQVVAAEKMRALGVLVAGVAHELGNPLTVLAGNLDPLEESLTAYETIVRAFERCRPGGSEAATAAYALLDAAGERRGDGPALVANCREASRRAVALLGQLRSFGRGSQAAVRRRTPLRPGLESTLALVRHRFPAAVRVQTRLADVPDVVCVPAEINQVFMNLLLNAADALRPEGTLELSLDHDERAVRVRVRDDGVGIAPAHVPRLFEPFFTTKEAGAGSGLGLAISHAIVARHGGRLEVTTPPEGGAVFTVSLPIAADGEEAPGLTPGATPIASAASGGTVVSMPQVGGSADVETVTQRVPEDVEGEDGRHDGQSWKDGQVGRHEHERARVVQHAAPGRRRWLRAETQKAE